MTRRRPAVTAAIGLALLGSLGTARASYPADPPVITVTHTAPLPCSYACGGEREAGFDLCGNPFPEGSYDKSTFRLTSSSGVTTVEARYQIAWFSVICTDTEPSVLVTSACGLCYGCDGIAAATDCSEWIDLTWSGLMAANGGANDRFIVMSYNWSDTEPSTVKLWGPVELVDDSYDARVI